jgi:hypothetical protein
MTTFLMHAILFVSFLLFMTCIIAQPNSQGPSILRPQQYLRHIELPVLLPNRIRQLWLIQPYQRERAVVEHVVNIGSELQQSANLTGFLLKVDFE